MTMDRPSPEDDALRAREPFRFCYRAVYRAITVTTDEAVLLCYLVQWAKAYGHLDWQFVRQEQQLFHATRLPPMDLDCARQGLVNLGYLTIESIRQGFVYALNMDHILRQMDEWGSHTEDTA